MSNIYVLRVPGALIVGGLIIPASHKDYKSALLAALLKDAGAVKVEIACSHHAGELYIKNQRALRLGIRQGESGSVWLLPVPEDTP